MIARIAQSSVTHVLFAFALMGGWACFANWQHPMPKPVVAALIQGTLSAGLTYFLKRTLDGLAARMTRGYSFWLPPLIACSASLCILLAAHFIALGYTEQGQYDFAQKKLRAKHFEHADDTQPKVFISELLVEEMPNDVQQIIFKMTDGMADDVAQQDDFLYSGTHWQVSTDEYETLVAHSEYAAWMSAWGFRANHFTVSLNHMGHFDSLAQMNSVLKESGFVLNSSGGETKGGPEVLLAQSSTMADKIKVEFANGNKLVPSCFYEFAQRYPMTSGGLYQGFVAASADKIFESTDT